jgi:hypothetical protein
MVKGVTNIIRFNWHFYIIAMVGITGLIIIHQPVIVALIVLSIIVSLGVSWYVYDYSDLYTLNWIDIPSPDRIVNINAGFDETSVLLAAKYPAANLSVFDFYDPLKHTAVSIKRARKAYGAYPGTIAISTSSIPSAPASVDLIVLMLAAHEIRDDEERSMFLAKLKNCLTDKGQILVLEHLRDLPNFMAYNIGFFHFFSRHTWMRTFNAAGLALVKETKLTPFLSAFILQ